MITGRILLKREECLKEKESAESDSTERENQGKAKTQSPGHDKTEAPGYDTDDCGKTIYGRGRNI